jgi:hypothetical protein
MTAAIDLDVLLKNYLAFVDQGGKDLLTNPFSRREHKIKNPAGFQRGFIYITFDFLFLTFNLYTTS